MRATIGSAHFYALRVRDLLDRPLNELTLDDVRAALSTARDEDDRWEVKGGTLRAEHVFRPVAGLGNRDGGLLVLGASRIADAGWQLDGARFAGEPGQWVARVIRDNLRPAPPYALRTFELSAGLHAVLVRVERHPQHLAVTADGRVLRREHGSTEPIADGAELTRLVRARSGAGPAASLDSGLAPDELADAALAVVDAGHEARLRSFVTGLQARLARAAEFEPREILSLEADRLSAICASLAQAAPESPVSAFATQAHHRAVDAAAGFHLVPGGRPDLDLFRVVLRNARALGALLVRLELWPLIRELVDHDAPGDDGIYPGWMTYVAVQEARALGRPANAEVLRHSVREARATALRVGALRPDAADEHQILDSLLIFDLLANLIELDRADRAGTRDEVSPDFAVFGAEPHRPLVRRVLDDDHLRAALLLDRRQRDAARLLLSLDGQARRVANACASFWPGIADRPTEQRMQTMAAGR